jgi:putative glutamine amidotransferase
LKGSALIGACLLAPCGAQAWAGAKPLVVGIADMCAEKDRVSVLATYTTACTLAGNTPLVLPATTNRAVAARMLASVDVLLLCGGEDVAPRRYKAKPSPQLGKVNLRRDAWEFLLLDEAVKLRMPVIGICRGCQLINVYFGGTLWQDLPSERPGVVVHRGKGAHHDIQIVAGSRLERSLGLNGSRVNTIHHQAVRDLAPGFRAVAFAADGVVEAIEGESLPVVGVQFHPEKLFVLKDRNEFRVLFADPLKWARP